MLSTFDFILIAVYLALTVAIGLACRGKQDSANDYFVVGGAMSGWFGSLLVGLSVAATLFSGISFLAYPSVIYGGGFILFFGAILVCFPLTYFFLRWFLPRYLAAGGQQPYEVIERRFGVGPRLVAAGMYVLLRIGWMGALIYAPTLAIMAAMGLGEAWFWPLILIIGISSTIYTVFGGLRGVIVTDAMQFVVMAVGIALTCIVAWRRIDVGMLEGLRVLNEQGRFHLAAFSLDPRAGLTVWTIAIGVTVANLSNYVGDQMSLQRYLATGNSRAALRSFVINLAGVYVVLFLLAAIGLLMFLFYHLGNDTGVPERADLVFPYFIATQLPAGVSGLLLAAILAATMSSITSGINALSATLTFDLQPRIGRTLGATERLRFARRGSFAVGLLATGTAGIVPYLGDDLFSMIQAVLGVFAGPLLVVMMVAVTRIACGAAVMMTAPILGCLAGWAVALSPMSSLWTAPVAAAVTLIVIYLGGLLASEAKVVAPPSVPTPDTEHPAVPSTVQEAAS